MSALAIVLTALLLAASVPVVLAALYLGALALLARRAPPPRPLTRPVTRFDVIVPAHNEELSIERTLRSLLAVDYPRDRFRVLVVADNCTDRTAELAAAEGAVVLERQDAVRRGKGYALEHAFTASRDAHFADAVVVIDADTVVSPNLLHAFDGHLADGREVLQADYGVRNPDASWRTRLMTIAFALFHGVRSEARERLRLSCGLRGNGMCFTHEVLERVPHRAFSIVEDVEHGIALGLAGVRVGYVAEAQVLGDMPETAAASRSQRDRWEGGRGALVRTYAAPLFRAAAARRDLVLADLALDLVVPPLSTLVAAAAGGLAIAAAAAWYGLAAPAAVAPWALAVLCLAGYIARGCALSGFGVRALAALAWAPLYILWKLALRLPRPGRRLDEWVRTARTAAR